MTPRGSNARVGATSALPDSFRRVSSRRLGDRVPKDLRRLVWSARGRFLTKPNWDLSDAYYGEELDLRRVEDVSDHPTGCARWQVHVRGYSCADGVELTAHFETDPSESPAAHVDRVGIDIRRGLETLRAALDANDAPHATAASGGAV
ncbi:hypothetical protein ACNS7O_02305 [Haloferacaceae archaeon DSL9]